MKRIMNISDGSYVIIGRAADIRATEKLFRRRCRRGHIEIFPLFANEPKFNPEKWYGLEVCDGYYTVLSQKTFVRYLLSDMYEDNLIII